MRLSCGVLLAILFLSASGRVLAAGALPRHAVFGAAVAPDAHGVVVVAVVPNSSAAGAGLRVKDVIASIDGAAVNSVGGFLATIHGSAAGATLQVAILRDGAPLTLQATLKAAPDEHAPGVRTTYESLSVDGTLRRTLVTVPDGTHGPLPAVLLVGGIGCYSVDVATDPNDGYARVMQDIARAGFLTMRLEKSGVGDSQGPPCRGVGFNDEMRSYAVALAALRSDPRVAAKHIYLLGHSIGTAIVPRLALTQPVAGLISSESFARDWFEYEMTNLRRQLELGDDPPDVIDAKMLSKARCMQHLLYDEEPQAQLEAADPTCKERDSIYPVGINYVQEIAALDIIAPWERVDVPVLVVYGSSDYVVDWDDAQRIVDVVNAHHADLATLVVVNGMTHQLRVSATQRSAMHDVETNVVEPYDADFSKAVVTWLCRRERCAGA